MNTTDSGTASISLPIDINFEIPHEYARHCNGIPVRVDAIPDFQSELVLQWNEESFRMTHQSSCIWIDRKALIGFIVNEYEEVAGMEACIFWIGLFEKNGNRMLLPIISSNPRSRDLFLALVDELRRAALPIKIYPSAQSMLHDNR